MKWDLPVWNSVVLEYFFGCRDDPRPITRLSVTPETIALAAGADEEDDQPAEQFIGTMRRHLFLRGSNLSGDLTSAVMRLRSAPARDPTFVAHLILTCLVATRSFSEGGRVQPGAFRARLADLLGRGQDTLYGLAEAWTALAEWLERAAAQGRPYRLLYLPNPGHMTIIGHSVRISFPARTDLKRLALILRHRELDDEKIPPVEVVRALAFELGSFSAAFVEVFDRFREVCISDGTVPDHHEFWSAVEEAIRFARCLETDRSRRLKTTLVIDPEERFHVRLLWLVEGTLEERALCGFRTAPAKYGVGSFDSVVVEACEEAEGRDQAVSKLLAGRADAVLQFIAMGAVVTAIRQGLLLFEENEEGVFGLAFRRPSRGSTWGLVADQLVSDLRRAFETAGAEISLAQARYSGWHEIRGADSSMLARLDFTSIPSLRDIRCLKPGVVAEAFSVEEGVRFRGNILGLREALPQFVHPTATRIAAQLEGGGEIDLVRTPGISSRWQFPVGRERDDDICGSVRLLAWKGDRLARQWRRPFVVTVESHDFWQPTDARRWLVEGLQQTLTEAKDETLSLGLIADRFDRTGLDVGNATHDSAAERADGSRLTASEATVAQLLDLPWKRFAESIAASGLRPGGIQVGDLFALACGFLRTRGVFARDLIRAWQEHAYFDLLQDRNWPSLRATPLRPRFLFNEAADLRRATLVGAVTAGMMRKAAKTASALGIEAGIRPSESPALPSRLEVSFRAIEEFQELCRVLELEEPLILRSHSGLRAAKEPSEGPEYPPEGFVLWRGWDWGKGRFRETARPISVAGVSVSEFAHPRAHREHYFLVASQESGVYTTTARNWALLKAYSLQRNPVFVRRGDLSIDRVLGVSVYLPLALARFAALNGLLAVESDSTGSPAVYSYTFARREARDACWYALFPHDAHGHQSPEVRRMALRVLRLAGESTGEAVGIPMEVRTLLARPSNAVEVRLLGRLDRVPPALYSQLMSIHDRIKNAEPKTKGIRPS